MANKNERPDDANDNPGEGAGPITDNVPARREQQRAPAARAELGSPRLVADGFMAQRPTIVKLLGDKPEAIATFTRVCMRHYAHNTNKDFVGDRAAAAMLAVDPHSYVLACIDAATDGLLPDGKQGVIVPRGKVAVWTPMWRGLVELARRGNPGLHMQAAVVYKIEIERGLFVADYVTGITRHTPWQIAGVEYEPKDEDIVCAYAIARDVAGRITDWRALWRDNLIKRAEKSGNPTNKEWSPAWKQWFPEMCQAKAIRALCDWMDVGTAYTDAVERHDDRERMSVQQLDGGPPAGPSNGARSSLADEIRGTALPEGRP